MPAASAALPGSRASIALRANGRYSRALGVQLLVPAALLGLVYIGSVAAASVNPYVLADEARASQAIIVIGPVAALSAAFEMRIVRLLWGRLDVRRSWWRVVLGRLWLVAAAGVAAMGIVYVAAAGPGFPFSSAGLQYPLVSLAGVVAWTAVGAALGLAFRPIAALPLALIVPYLLMVLPGAWSPLWLRHLTGLLFDCCNTNAILDSRAVVGSLAVLGAMTVAAAMVVYVRLGPLRPSLALLTASAALAVGLVVVGVGQASQLDALPTRARPATELQCGATVCLWPEDSGARHANEVALRRLRTAWAALGLEPPPRRVGPLGGSGTLDLAVLTPDPNTAAESMAIGLPRAVSGCADHYDDARVNAAADGLTYLLWRRMGIKGTEALALPPGPPPRAVVAPRLLAAMASCRS